jgi:hypothetical protein
VVAPLDRLAGPVDQLGPVVVHRAPRGAAGSVGARSFVVGVMRWGARVSAYFLLLTDKYPPFSLE